MAEGRVAEIWTFPTDPTAFDEDERISFSRLDNKHIAVGEDGAEYEFDAELRRWIPAANEDLIAQHQQGYVTRGAEDQPPQDPQQRPNKKRKHGQANNGEDPEGRSRGDKRQNTNRPDRQQQPRQNTAIYVTGLPLDATVDEVQELFSRKAGVIAEEIDSGRPRIKLYTDSDGNFKGDALIVFFKPQSVSMAEMLLDDTEFRFGSGGPHMKVQAAEASYKKTNYEAAAATADGEAGGKEGGAGGSSNAASNGEGGDKPRQQQARRSEHDKQKIIKKTQKLAAKLADWDDDEPATALPEVRGAKWEKVVILRHMFTLAELEEDPAALLDIKEDIREECAKLGPVTNVVLFDLEEDGIVSVRFQTPEAADACVKLMHGRAFDGRTVEAYYATGRERFRKSKKGDGGDEDGEDD